jgi:ubiquinone/menaquinone biosynthesis C-methylase UbiE
MSDRIEEGARNEAEGLVSRFYSTVGWETEQGVTEDARRWEDLRSHSRDYVSKCRLRVLRHIPEGGSNILDMASGPIQYKEYLEYSRNFEKRYCVDLSEKALEGAKEKIGSHGVFLHGSFFDIPFESDFFDCSVSLHTIYHIDKDRQEEAVRKLVRITKSGRPVIVVYTNPRTILSSLPVRALRRVVRLAKGRGRKSSGEAGPALYAYAHPNNWWARFTDVATVTMLPWRSLGSDDQQTIVPDNRIGALMLKVLFRLEDTFPGFFVKHFQYPMIVLVKK